MNLLQYLIAPHEQQQETEQDQLPQNQDLTQNAHYSQAPASMPIHQRRTPPSYTHSPVSQQGQQSSGTSGVLDREQLILSLEANPDVLASLIRTGGIAGLTTTLQHAQQTSSVTQHSSHGYSTGSPNRAVRSQAPQISSHAATVENRQICFWWYHTGNCNRHPQSSNFNGTRDHCSYLHELTSEDDILQFFPTLWHHGKGDCGLDRCRFSSTYRHLSRPFPKPKKNKKLKKSLQQSRQRSQIGDQELLQQQSHQQSPQLHRSSTPASTQQFRSPSSAQQYRSPSSVYSTGSGNGQSGSFKAINATYIPPPRMSNIPTGPAADRYGSDQRPDYRQRYQQESSPSTESLKRKASAMSSPIDPATMVIPTGPKISRKAAKHERKQAKQARKAQLALNAPTTPPKYFDIVPSLTSGFPPHSSTPAKKKTQTCFFWYHETCANTGPKCHLLHALLAGYVQPPRGYVHRAVCTRDWCPGDWMWEHEEGMGECERPLGEPYGQVEDNEDEHEAQAEDEDERRVNDRDDDKYERMHGLERARKKREIDECWKKHTQQQQEDGDDEQDEQDEQDEHGEYGSDDVVMGDCDCDLDLGHEEGEINEVDGEWYMEGAADA
ncbi:hypothetical protein D6D13_05008 [Aureobasidium pullulans]|uniref:C3H1-type domain-containing protein n=1 Tax=Aureobasidium pullulans TaxID=5580 RepID=A0A4S9CUH6_AURPU|nr:hypothetical protein D6D13_05008 [Aureobasidium pullulans]